jgi:DNA-binding CsgD family transcriptional regulator
VCVSRIQSGRAASSVPSRSRSARRELLPLLETAVLSGRGAVLAGAPGIGKSHLARAVGERLRTRGVVVESVLATEAASSVPFAALVPVLGPAVRADGDVLAILRGAVDALSGRARRARLVLVVDDAHCLDPASAALLLVLCTRHGVRLLATIRAGAPAPDAVRALWKDAGLERAELGPLSEEETAEMARQLLGGPVEAQTRRWLWQTSGGNPLFLRELIRSGVEHAALVQEAGHWRRAGGFVPTARLIELLDARIEELSPAERRAFGFVVLAEPAPLALLEQLDALEGARGLEARGLVASAHIGEASALRAAHPLYGELLGASLTALEARALHAELARHLDADAGRTCLRLAAWALADGVAAEPRLLADGAREALTAFDPDLAIRLGSAAAEADPSVDATLPLAEALRARGRYEEAEQRLAAVEEEALRTRPATRYLFIRATNLQWGLERNGEAEALLERFEDDSAAVAVRAALRSSSGRLADGVSCAREAVAVAAIDRLACASASLVLGRDLALLGCPREALAALDRAERTCDAVESEWPRAALAALAARAAGEGLDNRRRALEARYETARAAGDDARAAMCEFVLARLALSSGPLASAARYAEDALARLAFMDPRRLAAACEATRAEATAQAGHVQEARAALERAEILQQRGPAGRLSAEAIEQARIAVLAVEGDLAGAQRAALVAAGGAGEALATEAELLHLYVRVGGDPVDVVERLGEIAGATDAGLTSLLARHADAAAGQRPQELEQVATDFERFGLAVYAAESVAQAAVVHGRHGRDDARRRAEARAARLAHGVGARGLVLVQSLHQPSLTRREREVATLVARGLSNAEVADRLSLSVRTVESHIYRASTKLGVRDRRALVALLAGRQPRDVPTR